ncbi:MAG: peptide deformylase [bacterium]
MTQIITIDNKKDETFLRTPVPQFDFSTHTTEEVRALVQLLRQELRLTAGSGVGLSANQIGLSDRVFIVQYNKKFYTIFNPEIIKMSQKIVIDEEGCLSIPNTYIDVPRAERITIVGYGQNGKKTKINASDVLARIFQHETDHLNGILIIDRVAS